MRAKGRVYLVGSGPGDPDLVTVKGARLIESCNCLVYDALAPSELVSRSRAVEKIYVGKRAGLHAMPQDEISRLLVEKASEYASVVRLKGGDPFVFGRGGEEAIHLAEAGVLFEVVPGVTSAVAAPAYAGIPVTHRGLAAQVTFITGHEDPTKDSSDLDYALLARTPGTLVFLMGMKNAPVITRRLIEEGMDPSTPAAIIHKGTTPEERTFVEPLSEIAEKASIGAPSILLVGKVASLAEKIGWFERLPLFGRRIVVTRTRRQLSGLVQSLRALGAGVIELPTIRTVPPESFEPLDDSIRNLDRFDTILFTSPNGVSSFIERLHVLKFDSRALSGVVIGVIGPGTASALRGAGIEADILPERFVAEGLLEALDEDLSGRSILIPRAAEAREILPEGLRRRGAEVEVVPAYRTIPEDENDPAILAMLSRGEADLVTFTSSSTVTNYLALFDSPPSIPAAAIGPITAGTAREGGIEVVIEAREHTINGLVSAILEGMGQGKADG